VSIVLSVLLHGALAGALIFGWWTYHQKTQAVTPTLAIEATVVDSKSVKGATTPTPQPPAPTPPPPPAPPPPQPTPPPPVEDTGPPQPTPDELAQRAQKEKQQQEAQEKAEQEAQQKAQQKADEQAAEQKRVADEQKRQAQQKAEAERKAKEEAQKKAEEAKLAAQKKVEDDKRKAQQAQQAQQLAQSEADLKRSLAAEEHANAVRSSGALASWEAQLKARIERAWLRPPSARAGIVCELDVTQVPGGEVTNVKLGSCNGDQAVRDSIVAAVYRASPLPPPPDPSLFERELQITFSPTD
jgi:colicin import membrane protein